jgi:hypothetical protein
MIISFFVEKKQKIIEGNGICIDFLINIATVK